MWRRETGLCVCVDVNLPRHLVVYSGQCSVALGFPAVVDVHNLAAVCGCVREAPGDSEHSCCIFTQV